MRKIQQSLAVCGTLLVLIGAPLAYATSAGDQTFKMRTGGGGTTYYEGRCFLVNFRIQTDNMDLNSADLRVPYDPAILEPHSNSSCTSVATTVLTDGLFPTYPGAGNKIETNTLKLTGVDTGGTSPVNTGAAPADSLFAHMYFKVLSTSGAYNLNFDFTVGNTTDTNFAENAGTGADVLDFVENLTLNLAADNGTPTFSALSPANAATNVSVTTDPSFTISDAETGVDASSITGTLNGVSLALSPSCSTTDSNRVPSCNVSSSAATLSYATTYTVVATGADLAVSTHTGSTSWQFTTEDDTDAPYVENQSPAANDTGVAVGSNIVFNIKDFKSNGGLVDGLGVDINSVMVTLTGAGISTVTYKNGDPEFSFTGSSETYQVTINPPADFAENTVVHVTITGADLHSTPNVMNAVKYYFTTIDTGGPQITDFIPSQGASGVAADTNILFRLADNGAGIDLANSSITIEGITYTSGSGTWTTSGSSAAYDITINPASNFVGGQVIDVAIATQDLANPTPNTASSNYTFTIGSDCTSCSVDTEDPPRFSTTATLDNTISFHVKDSGDGISSNSISALIIGTGAAVPVSAITYTGASTEMTIVGSSSDYTVTITLPANIEQNTAYSITINATDINGLAMSTVGYTFSNLVTTTTTTTTNSCPMCPSCETASTGGGGGGSRGHGTRTTRLVTSENLPTIIARRRIPGQEGYREEVLDRLVARTVDECYIEDDTSYTSAPEQKTHYTDVPAGAWYEDALQYYLEKGVLDSSKTAFNGNIPAQRAEFTKFMVLSDGGEIFTPDVPSFNDIRPNNWFYGYIETAAQKGWIKGDNNCYNTGNSCSSRADKQISRAEAAALVVRYFSLEGQSLAPTFGDIPDGAWFDDILQTAADYCIVQGEAGNISAPQRPVNRAEMVAMFHRAEQKLQYGVDCEMKPESASNLAGSLTAQLSKNAFGASILHPNTILLGLLSVISTLLVILSMVIQKNKKKM